MIKPLPHTELEKIKVSQKSIDPNLIVLKKRQRKRPLELGLTFGALGTVSTGYKKAEDNSVSSFSPPDTTTMSSLYEAYNPI